MLRQLKNPRSVLLIFAIITVVKIGLFLSANQLGYFEPFAGAGARQQHIPGARNILELGSFNSAETARLALKPPGYATLIALLQSITSSEWKALLVALQMVFDFFTATTICFLGSRYGILQAGALAGIGWLLFPPAAMVSTWIAPASLFTLLLVGAIALLLRSVHNAQPALGFAAGIVIGIATLVRAAPMAFPFLFLLVAMFKPFPRARLIGALMVLGTVLVITPWAIRNRVVLGENIIVRYGVGMVFMQGSEKAMWDLSRRSTPEGSPKLIANAEAVGIVAPTDGMMLTRDRWRFKVGLLNYKKRLKERPGSFVPFLSHKFMRLWYGMESCNRNKQLFLGLCSLLVVPLGLIQIYQWRKTHRDLAIVLGLMIVYFCTLHWVLLAHFRYLLPSFPFLMLATVTWLTSHGNRLRRRSPEIP